MIITLYTYSPKDQRWFYLNGIALWSTAPGVVTNKWCVLDSDTEVAIIGFLFGWVTNTWCHPPRGWIRRNIHRLVFGILYDDTHILQQNTVYPKKYAQGFVVLCFVVVIQSFIMNSHEVFIHIHQGCFAGTGAIVRLPQCQWSKPDGYGKISQCITTTKHSKAKTACIFLGIYCSMTQATYTIDI